MIYLDNAATTYPKPEVVYTTLDNANRKLAFNAGRGSYKKAQEVSKIIQETKQLLADLVHTTPDKVAFESSATESLNIIINGLDLCQGDTVYVSPFEHNAVIRPLYNLQKETGINIEIIPFDEKTWQLKEEDLKDLLTLKPPKAVFCSHISNVTGYILPFEQLFKAFKRYNAVTVIDCSQSLGVLNPDTENVDFLVFAGHKSLYASFGIAGFFNLSNMILKITKSGGTGSDSLNHDMPESGAGRYEAGSLNGVAVAGLNASLKWLKINPVYEHEKELTDYALEQLKTVEKVNVFLPDTTERIFGVISIDVDGYTAADVGSILSDEYDICVRTGYHCSPFVHEFIGSKNYLGTIRIGLGAFTTKDDIDALIDALKSL